MRERFLGLPRVAATAIVLIAAALMLLNPLCDWHGDARSHVSTLDRVTASTQAAHSDDASADPCCSSSGIAVVSAARTASFDRSGGSFSIAFGFVPGALVALSVAAHAMGRRRPTRTPQSYYLRTARILR